MACNVRYIRQSYAGHSELIQRLEEINSDIWFRINNSKLFRKYGKERLFSKPGTEQYRKQVNLIRQINQDYHAPKSIVTKKITKSGYNEKVKVSLHPIAEQVWRETDAAKKVREDAMMGITPTGDSDTTLLANPTKRGGTDPDIQEKYFGEGNETTSKDILEKIGNSNHSLAPLAKTLLKYDIDPVTVRLIDSDGIETTASDGTQLDAAGVYYPGKGVVEIAKNATFKGRGSEPTILHEILHALTYSQIHGNDQLSKDFNKLYEAAKVYEATFTDTYPLTNADEFLTGIFTNAQFINELKNIPAIEGTKYKNLWEQILDYFKLLFGIPQEEENLFTQAIAAGTNLIVTNAQEREAYIEFSQLSDDQFLANPTRTGFTATKSSNDNKESKTPEDISSELVTRANDMELRDVEREQEDGTYAKEPRYFVKGKEIAKRVSDLVKKLYSNMFRNKDMEKSDAQQAIDEIHREKGSKGHKDFQHALTLMVDSATNKLVSKEQYKTNLEGDKDYPSEIGDKRIYEALRDNLWDRLHLYDKNSIFLSEVGVYNDTRTTKNSSIGGTMDLVILEPDEQVGTKVNILDWKFINLNTDKYDDVPWYKIRAWRLQMDTYKQILKEAYGIKEDQFGHTRMIPIVTEYQRYYDVQDHEWRTDLKSVQVGTVNTDEIPETHEFLLPVATESEKTGDENIDKLLTQLNALYKQISEKAVPESERRDKADRLNNLFRAIRVLQMKGDVKALIKEVNTTNGNAQLLINEFNEKYTDPEVEVTNAELSEFSKKAENLLVSLHIYEDLQESVKNIRSKMDDDDPIKVRLDMAIRDAGINRHQVEEVIMKFVDNMLAKRKGFDQFLDPEGVVRGLGRMYLSTDSVPTDALHILSGLTNEAKNKTDAEVGTMIELFTPIRDAYEEYAKSKGFKRSNYFNVIKQKDKNGKVINQLVSQYKREFYETLKKKVAQGDKEWIKKNIDMAAYKGYLAEQLKDEIEALKVSDAFGRNADGSPEQNAERYEAIQNAKRRYNLGNPDSFAWKNYKEMRQFPTSAWESEGYKNLQKPENKAAKDLYEFIKERNAYHSTFGYISKAEARYFLPYVRSGTIERAMCGNKLRPFREFLNSISIDETTTGFGKFDPLTGEVVNTIPKYFTSKLKDENEVSNDIFQNLIIMEQAAIRYKNLNEIEGQVKALLSVERMKKHLNPNKAGNDKTEGGNERNADLLAKHIELTIYDKRTDTDLNTTLNLAGYKKIAARFNKFVGANVLPTKVEDKVNISAVRALNTLTNYFYKLHLNNLNIMSPIANTFGGTIQTIINAGPFFKSKDVASSLYRSVQLLVPGVMNYGEKNINRRAAIDFFGFTTEQQYKIKAAQLSFSKINSHNIHEWTSGLIGKSDRFVQNLIGLCVLENTVVVGGKLMLAQDYVHSQQWYRDRYNTPSQVKEIERRANDEIKKLKAEKGIYKVAEIVNDKWSIPGIGRDDVSVQEIRNLVFTTSRKALGNMTEAQARAIDGEMLLKSMMVFKNWIPGILEARTGKMKYNSSSKAWEWGRIVSAWKLGGGHLLKSMKYLIGWFNATDGSIEDLRRLYEKQKEHIRDTRGRELDMSFEEFADMMRDNLKSNIKDFLTIGTAMSVVLLAKAVAPDDDDDEDPRIKSYHNFILRTLDRLQDEVTFYYNPVEFEQMVAGEVFPVASMLTNGFKLIQNFTEEMYGLTFNNEEMVESAKPTKYLMRTFPFANQITSYLPLFAPETAKEWGVRINSTHNIE